MRNILENELAMHYPNKETPYVYYSAWPHRHFHTLPGVLHSLVALPNSYQYPNACMPSREAFCTIFMIVFSTRSHIDKLGFYIKKQYKFH